MNHEKYVCSVCGVKNCKLYREYMVFANHVELMCLKCSAELEKIEIKNLQPDGKHETRYGMTDQVGSMIPAVPTKEGDTFWGYCSVPDEGCIWWKSLPNYGETK